MGQALPYFQGERPQESIVVEMVDDLTRIGRRASTQLVRLSDGGLGVRKRFFPGAERHFEREVEALRALGGIRPDLIPPILELGPDYLVIPYYAGKIDFGRFLGMPGIRYLPLPLLREIFGAAREFYEAGYVLLDFHMANIIVTPRDGIKFIDFEYAFNVGDLHRRIPFEESYTLCGPPPDWDDDLPFMRPTDGRHYQRSWRYNTGLTAHSLLNDPAWLQHLKRTAFFPVRLATTFRRRVADRIWQAIRRRLRRAS